MLLSVTLVCLIALGLGTVSLVFAGHRIRSGSRWAGTASALCLAAGAAWLAERLWHLPSAHTLAGAALLAFSGLLVVAIRPQWNPVGQVFFASLVASAAAYLAFAGHVTVAGRWSPLAIMASLLLLALEAAALVLAGTFAFEACDVSCRVRWTRATPLCDPTYLPKVSLHVPAYNEPPDMLIQTIASLEAQDYPDFEIVVIDNNTTDKAMWEPVRRYCRRRRRVRFVHVEGLEGFKSGALNLALRSHTDPAAEIVGVIDADYLVRPDYLRRAVGYFAEERLAFVQTPQDYREYEGDAYMTACYDAYKYFFETAMPSRNDRDSIIFGGTMGLIRRRVLDEIGGWDEWCITEDAEASLRILKAGYSGFYLNESFGRGIMPLTFTALKRQRFRWCFGGVQILRKHWRSLMPWNRDSANRLSRPQRFDYLLGGFQWFNDLVSLGFTGVLGVAGFLLITQGRIALRPLLGAAVLLPSALIASGLLRALWTLRRRTGISFRRAVLAFANWLSVSLTVGIACMQGLTHREGVFLRTPKWKPSTRLVEALRETKAETGLALSLWSVGVLAWLSGRGEPFLLGLFGWQGLVYAAAPVMAWLNLHTELSAQLERRRRSEERRERMGIVRPRLVGAGALTAAAAAFVLLGFGGTQPGPGRQDLFRIPNTIEAITLPNGTAPGTPAEDAGQLEEAVSSNGGEIPTSGSDEPARPQDVTPSPDAPASEAPTPEPLPTPSSTPTPDSAPSAQPGARPSSTPTPMSQPSGGRPR